MMTLDEVLQEICDTKWRDATYGDAIDWATYSPDECCEWTVCADQDGWQLRRVGKDTDLRMDVAAIDDLPRAARALETATAALWAAMEVERWRG